MFRALVRLFRSPTPAEKWESDQAKMRVSTEELAELQGEFPETAAMHADAKEERKNIKTLVSAMFDAMNAPAAMTKRFANRCSRLGGEGSCLDAIVEGIQEAEDLPPGFFILADWKDMEEFSSQIARISKRLMISMKQNWDGLPMDHRLRSAQGQLQAHGFRLVMLDTSGDDIFAFIVLESKFASLVEAAGRCGICIEHPDAAGNERTI